MSSVAIPFATDTVTVVAWPDRTIDAVGHDPRSPYVERFWLPVLGPSTVWLLRLIANDLDHCPDGFELNLAETARALGLANNPGRHGPFVGALVRMVQFGAAQYVPSGLAVRRRLPYLPPRHLERLSAALQTEHVAFVERADRDGSAADRRRAYSLALTLVRLGENLEEVRSQLIQWRFNLELADDAATWATSRTADPEAA
jgi:hypothetical protein